jgi:anti-anti-sigma factor
MTLNTTQTTEEIRIVLDGELDLSSIDSFKSAIKQAMGLREGRKFTIDLQGTAYIDSAGLEQLLVVSRKLITQGNRLTVVVKQNSQPQNVLVVAGFGVVMDIEPALGVA